MMGMDVDLANRSCFTVDDDDIVPISPTFRFMA
jgi:hypothetical protein